MKTIQKVPGIPTRENQILSPIEPYKQRRRKKERKKEANWITQWSEGSTVPYSTFHLSQHRELARLGFCEEIFGDKIRNFVDNL